MNITWYTRVLACLLFGVATAITIWQANKKEHGHAPGRNIYSRFSPYINPWLLPLSVSLYLIVSLLLFGFSHTIDHLFPALARIFLHINIYNAILLLLLPYLRKHLSARVCATLWILPNILYIAYNPIIMPGQPLLILPLTCKRNYLPLLIWFIGFSVALLYQIVSHILFRRKILKNAQSVWDTDIQRIWHEVLEVCQFNKRYYPVLRARDVLTPLSIGFFPKTTCVILPQREYTQEEFRLILRHEAIHIGRQDSFRKFFMTFCACVCWFNPIAWMAVHHCSMDMELSCDETVLLKENRETRQCYAELLLKTAGDDRGFSTCLSASARTMLYRLTHTLMPQKRFLGAIAAGIAIFLLLSTCGLIAIAYNPETGAECIFDTIGNASWDNNIIYSVNEARNEYVYSDISILLEYISEINFYQLTGAYSYPNDDISIIFSCVKTDYMNNHAISDITSNSSVDFVFTDHTFQIIDYSTGSGPEIKTYYHNVDIDWDYLVSQTTPVS